MNGIKLWKPESFPISYWAGPPAGIPSPLDALKVAKAAGFNLIMPPIGASDRETNFKILSAANELQLKTILADPRIPPAVSGISGAAENLAEVVKDYSAHPAFAGYFLQDEPFISDLPGLRESP